MIGGSRCGSNRHRGNRQTQRWRRTSDPVAGDRDEAMKLEKQGSWRAEETKEPTSGKDNEVEEPGTVEDDDKLFQGRALSIATMAAGMDPTLPLPQL